MLDGRGKLWAQCNLKGMWNIWKEELNTQVWKEEDSSKERKVVVETMEWIRMAKEEFVVWRVWEKLWGTPTYEEYPQGKDSSMWINKEGFLKQYVTRTTRRECGVTEAKLPWKGGDFHPLSATEWSSIMRTKKNVLQVWQQGSSYQPPWTELKETRELKFIEH